jgi:hypothetical protein
MKLLTSIRKLFKTKNNFPLPKDKIEELGVTGIRNLPNGIDILRFYDNLLITQYYCEQQMIQFPEKPAGLILRSYNENYGRKSLTPHRKVDLRIIELVPEMFLKQLEHKNTVVTWEKSAKDFEGRIIVIDYEAAVIDGVSESESDGFIDLYDLPPIDTWFYMTKNNEDRVDLYAWVPNYFVPLVEGAIAVNCLDLISWVNPKEFGF